MYYCTLNQAWKAGTNICQCQVFTDEMPLLRFILGKNILIGTNGCRLIAVLRCRNDLHGGFMDKQLQVQFHQCTGLPHIRSLVGFITVAAEIKQNEMNVKKDLLSYCFTLFNNKKRRLLKNMCYQRYVHRNAQCQG